MKKTMTQHNNTENEAITPKTGNRDALTRLTTVLEEGTVAHTEQPTTPTEIVLNTLGSNRNTQSLIDSLNLIFEDLPHTIARPRIINDMITNRIGHEDPNDPYYDKEKYIAFERVRGLLTEAWVIWYLQKYFPKLGIFDTPQEIDEKGIDILLCRLEFSVPIGLDVQTHGFHDDNSWQQHFGETPNQPTDIKLGFYENMKINLKQLGLDSNTVRRYFLEIYGRNFSIQCVSEILYAIACKNDSTITPTKVPTLDNIIEGLIAEQNTN